MKKPLFISFLLLSVCALFAPAIVHAQSNRVQVNFNFARQRGFSSNQFAVWIEDAQGRFVKTLYITRFTAAGGWQKREQSLPQWVRQANPAGMNKTQIDAITGPTPQSGPLHYYWDGTDSTGRTVSIGEYRVIVEGTLRNENRVLYTAAFKLGERGQTTAQVQYFGSNTADRGMLGPVTVTWN